MSDSEPIPFRARPSSQSIHRVTMTGPASANTSSINGSAATTTPQICFNRLELTDILDIYGRMVASGEWRDYAIDMGRDKAVFSVFRRTTEFPLYRIEKQPKLARKQGAYSVVAANGHILKRGPDLKRVLEVLDVKLKPVR